MAKENENMVIITGGEEDGETEKAPVGFFENIKNKILEMFR